MSASDEASGAGQKTSGSRREPKPAKDQAAKPERPADVLAADQARNWQTRWIVLSVSVGLAIIVPIARQVWRWVWENRTRARLDQQILHELEA